MIEACNVSKSFGSFKALDDLSLNVKHSSVYGLIGPNGAGKTTIMKHIAGVFRQDSGVITIDGETVFENPKIKERIFYIPDDLFFFSTYNIKDMAGFYSRVYPKWNKERYHHLKEVFQIDEKRRVTRLSKGMQKQVAFWMALCVVPDILILDEPVDELDPVARRKVWNLIMQDVTERGTTVLISSHNLRELEDICNHVGIIHQGKMMLEKNLEEAKSDIHKFQLSFTDGIPDELRSKLNILNETKIGSVITLIIKGDKDQVIFEINPYRPIILDVLPLSLEEVFIYELGGAGYEIKDVIL